MKTEKIKNHAEVTITSEMIKSYKPCPNGLKAAQKFLPLTISTDPDENAEVACLLVESKARTKYDLVWLFERVTGQWLFGPSTCSCGICDNAAFGRGEDAFQMQQNLAWLADAIATEQGR